MTNEQKLEQRLLMIAEDLKVIKGFIQKLNLTETFEQPTDEADECWVHISNIEIACNLSTDESLSWKSFNNK